MPDTDIRDNLLAKLTEIESAFSRLTSSVGNGHKLTLPDVFKLTEGLILNGWTQWEQFLIELLTDDLATATKGTLLKSVKSFKTTRAPWTLSGLILNHPDHPDKFADWSYENVVSRANRHLPKPHRYKSLAQKDDLGRIKRIRNAVAHRSDSAWDKFRTLAKTNPFNLNANQLKGLTPGRLLFAHTWNGDKVFSRSISVLKSAALAIVP